MALYKLLKTRKEMEITDHHTYLLRSLYAGHEAAVKKGYGTTDWFHIWKEVHQG